MKKIARLMTLALAVFTMASCEDVPSPYGTVTPPPTPSEVIPTGDGTATNPFNVTAAVAKCKEVGTEPSTEKYYVTGVVVTAGAASADFGNAEFTISDEGSTAKFKCYQVAGPDGKKLPSGYSFDVGDVVVVYGQIYNFKGTTPETAGKGTAWVVLHNGNIPGGETPSGEAKGTGTLEDPFNAVAANLEASKLASGTTSDKQYYIKGKVAKIASSGNYGEGKYPATANYYISDDGEDANTFYIYASKYLGNKDYSEGAVLKVGDEVIVFGNITNYNGTYETAQNKNYLYSLNGENGGGSDTGGDTPSGEVKTVTVSQFLAASVSTTEWYQLTGTVTHLEDGTYNNSTKYGNFDLVDETGTIYVYGVVAEKGGASGKFAELMTAKGIKDGSKITIIGNRADFKGTAQVGNAYFVSVESGESGGGASFSAGKYFITYKSGDTYYVAKPLDEASVSKGYGYSYCAETTATDGKLNNVDASNLFTFTAITGGFSIQDANNVYYYTNDKNKSFQVSATAPTGFYWTVTLGTGGTAKINSSAKTDYNIVHVFYNNKTHEFIPSDTGDAIILAKEDGTLLQ